MVYFMVATFVSTALLCLLVLLLVRRARINHHKANTSALSYLLPVVLAIAIVVIAIFDVYPRLIDIPSVLADNFETFETTIQAPQHGALRLTLEGKTIIVPPGLMPPVGTRVRFYVTPMSNVVIKVDTLSRHEPTRQ